MPYENLSKHLYLVGGPKLSHPLDCNVYLIDGRPTECLLIDSGCGLGVERILKNIEEIGFDLGLISAVVNSHCHYRHAGGNFRLNKMLGYVEVIIHELDAPPVEKGDPLLTGADFYNQRFEPCEVNVRAYTDDTETMKQMGFGNKLWISVGDVDFVVTPTPGHTPGSMSIHGKLDGFNILFSGDINAPIRKERGSEVEKWRKSLYHLQELNIDRIYAGHQIVIDKPKRWLKSLLEKQAPS